MFNSFVIALLDFILQHNYLIFNGVYYRPVSGTAMVAHCTPSYANFFLGWWEEVHVHPMALFQNHIIKWARYIDDVLFLWPGTRDECLHFINILNDNPFNTHLMVQLSESSVNLLDLNPQRKGNRICTTLHRKSTATNSLLHFSSFHPFYHKQGLPVGHLLRVRRNCTKHTDFWQNGRDFTTRLHNRGYPKHIVSRAYQRARTSKREKLVTTKHRKADRTLRFVT